VSAVESGDFCAGNMLQPWELLYFEVCKVIEQALETAGLKLGTDKSRGYCLEMICADFFGRKDQVWRNHSGSARAFVVTCDQLLSHEQQSQFLCDYGFVVPRLTLKQPRIRLEPEAYKTL